MARNLLRHQAWAGRRVLEGFSRKLEACYEAFKKEGLFSEYKVWTNPEIDHPDDWDVAVGLMVANYAALDQFDAKGATIAAQHYGSRDAMIEAGKKRADIREVTASKLAREVMPK